MINCCYSTLLLALNNNNICSLFNVDKRLKSIEPQKNWATNSHIYLSINKFT